MEPGLGYVELLEFGGRDRKLRFRIADVGDLQARLSTPAVRADHDAIFAQLGGLSVFAVYVGLFVGLRHEDKKLKPADISDHVQSYVDAGGTLDDLAAAVIRALNRAGIRPRVTEPGEATTSDPSGAIGTPG